MGRYYQGDIEGKFWFAIQDSNAADRFGSIGYEPQIIHYYFDEEHLDDVKKEIANIENTLGDKRERIKKFFEGKDSYNDEMLMDIGINGEDLSNYADLLLGIKIRDCIEATGQCQFDAEY
jgi:hypothetical protein